jgi:two-component system response regulator AtoC
MRTACYDHVVAGASPKLLLVEDDRIIRITVRDALARAGYKVSEHSDGAAALRAAESEAFDMVLTDVRLPGMDGISLFRRIRQLQPDAAVLLFTGYADVDDAVTVTREGARDYIEKPFEMDELLARLDRIREEMEFRRAMQSGGAARAPREQRALRGISIAWRRVVERIEAAAATDVNVLVTGETGTGKDLCAGIIHERSARASRPFVAVNCAAIPEALFEAELFGHERGAFTGADRRRAGRFEAANGGTLFLDEVGELPAASQAKLLRVLETSSFEPVGTSEPVKVNVRIVAASNRNLEADSARGAFRRDLFYRLNVFDIEMPPLRERRPDIPVLVSDFLAELATRSGKPVPALDPPAVAALATYHFPGNVRELLHALERAVALARDGVIRLEHLPRAIAGSNVTSPLADDRTAEVANRAIEPLATALAHFEREYIRRALDLAGGHRGRAAALLGISRKALWLRLRGSEEPDSDEDDPV